MSKYSYNILGIMLVAILWLAIPFASHAQNNDPEFGDEYCYRDSDMKPYETLPGIDLENNSAGDMKQIIKCNDSSTIADKILADVSGSLDIVSMNCNPLKPETCYDNNIDYKNFTISVKYTPPFGGEGTYAMYVQHSDSGNKSVDLGLVKLTFQKMGSQACIYLSGDFPISEEVNKLLINIKTHCVFIPPPPSNYVAPQWSTVVADVCMDYTKGHSQYRFMPVTGVVVECVETTMRNIFSLKRSGAEVDNLEAPLFALNDPNDYDRTFFSQVQENLRGMVLAVLVLYVTIFGLNVVMGQKIPSKGEFIMAVLKFALVLYFTLGTGIVDFVPRLIEMSKTLSLIMMESSENLPIKYEYCQFSNEQYPAGYKTMELWDIIDCKMSKYLGFREGGMGHPDEPYDKILNDSAPKVIVMALIFWGGGGAGLIVIVFALSCAVFMISLIVRVAHVYIIAMMAIYFLAFLAPLIIPTALFKYTEDLFNNWLKQLISFALQPVILFAFLAVLFAVSDFVMFRGNNQFCAETDSIRMVSQDFSESRECGPHVDVANNWKCPVDDSAPACIIMKKTSVGYVGGSHFPTWNVVEGANPSDVILAFMLLFFVFFVLNSMIPTIEELSHRLTDSSGGGAIQMATGTKAIGPGAGVSFGARQYGKAAGIAASPAVAAKRAAMARFGKKE